MIGFEDYNIFFLGIVTIYFLFVTFILLFKKNYLRQFFFFSFNLGFIFFFYTFSSDLFLDPSNVFVSLFFETIIIVYILNQKKNVISYLEYILYLTINLCVFFSFCSTDLLSLVISLEIISFCLYILAINSYSSSHSSLLYMLPGAISSSISIFGISLIYNICCSFDLTKISICFESFFFDFANNKGFGLELLFLYVGVICILLSFFFKFALFPMQSWLIEMYRILKFNVLFFFVIFTNLFFFFVFVLKFFPFFQYVVGFFWFLSIVGFISITIAVILGFFENEVRMLIAYSSILTMGYMFLLLNNKDVLDFLLFYLFLYTLNMGMVIFFFCELEINQSFFELNDLGNLIRLRPSFLKYLLFFLFSLCGLPPLLGFFPKIILLLNLVGLGDFNFYWIFYSFSIFSSYIYLRFIFILLLGDNDDIVFLNLKFKSFLRNIKSDGSDFTEEEAKQNIAENIDFLKYHKRTGYRKQEEEDRKEFLKLIYEKLPYTQERLKAIPKYTTVAKEAVKLKPFDENLKRGFLKLISSKLSKTKNINNTVFFKLNVDDQTRACALYKKGRLRKLIRCNRYAKRFGRLHFLSGGKNLGLKKVSLKFKVGGKNFVYVLAPAHKFDSLLPRQAGTFFNITEGLGLRKKLFVSGKKFSEGRFALNFSSIFISSFLDSEYFFASKLKASGDAVFDGSAFSNLNLDDFDDELSKLEAKIRNFDRVFFKTVIGLLIVRDPLYRLHDLNALKDEIFADFEGMVFGNLNKEFGELMYKYLYEGGIGYSFLRRKWREFEMPGLHGGSFAEIEKHVHNKEYLPDNPDEDIPIFYVNSFVNNVSPLLDEKTRNALLEVRNRHDYMEFKVLMAGILKPDLEDSTVKGKKMLKRFRKYYAYRELNEDIAADPNMEGTNYGEHLRALKKRMEEHPEEFTFFKRVKTFFRDIHSVFKISGLYFKVVKWTFICTISFFSIVSVLYWGYISCKGFVVEDFYDQIPDHNFLESVISYVLLTVIVTAHYSFFRRFVDQTSYHFELEEVYSFRQAFIDVRRFIVNFRNRSRSDTFLNYFDLRNFYYEKRLEKKRQKKYFIFFENSKKILFDFLYDVVDRFLIGSLFSLASLLKELIVTFFKTIIFLIFFIINRKFRKSTKLFFKLNFYIIIKHFAEKYPNYSSENFRKKLEIRVEEYRKRLEDEVDTDKKV